LIKTSNKNLVLQRLQRLDFFGHGDVLAHLLDEVVADNRFVGHTQHRVVQLAVRKLGLTEENRAVLRAVCEQKNQRGLLRLICFWLANTGGRRQQKFP
jgi:hypothetical protein